MHFIIALPAVAQCFCAEEYINMFYIIGVLLCACIDIFIFAIYGREGDLFMRVIRKKETKPTCDMVSEYLQGIESM